MSRWSCSKELGKLSGVTGMKFSHPGEDRNVEFERQRGFRGPEFGILVDLILASMRFAFWRS